MKGLRRGTEQNEGNDKQLEKRRKGRKNETEMTERNSLMRTNLEFVLRRCRELCEQINLRMEHE